MGFRTVYGNTISEDGWRMCDADECDWVTVPGTNVTLQIRRGVPATILSHFAARFNQVIEPLRDADSACWTATNDVATSNHLAGTAVDLNWDSHPFHVAGTFGDRLPRLRALLDEFKGCVWWGGDWTDPIDEMHFQLAYPEGDPQLTSLARELQSGETLTQQSRYALAIIVEGQRRGITPRGIQIALATALVESNLTNYANSKDPASMALPHDAVGSDGMSVGIFQQQDFPEWGPLECRMDPACSAGTFYDHLIRLDYNNEARSPGSYAQAVQRSAFPDRYDERFDEAVAIYTRLAGAAPSPWPPPAPQPPIPEGESMALVPQQQWDQLFHALMDPVPSQSPLRELGEGTIGSIAKLIRNIDGSVHVAIVEALAKLGDPEELARLHRIATADPVRYPDRQKDAVLAATILARIAAHPDTTTPPAQPPVPVVPIPPWPTTPPSGSTTGQHVGQLYDALEQLHLAGTLPPEVQAPLAALINVLQSYPHEGS